MKNMDLRETTAYLLRLPDIGAWMKLADNYIQTYNRLPERFVLPADHALLKPIIEAFASDGEAFSQYLRALRDAADGVAYDELHALYRTVSVRVLQLVRRTRLRKATLLLVPQLEPLLGRGIGYDDQQRVAKFLEQCWGAMRMAAMSEERNSQKAKHLSSDNRGTLLDDFWKQLDLQITQGTVPLGEATLNDIVNLFPK
jgi:hypothetical protein